MFVGQLHRERVSAVKRVYLYVEGCSHVVVLCLLLPLLFSLSLFCARFGLDKV